MRRRAALRLLTGAAALFAAPAAAVSTDGTARREAALLTATNAARSARGLPALSSHPALAAAARAHAEDMRKRGYLAHVDPDGRGPAERSAAAGYGFRRLGENLAVGQPDASAVIADWTDSAGHARNLFDPSYRDIGVAYRPGPVRIGGVRYGHVWVSVYGLPR